MREAKIHRMGVIFWQSMGGEFGETPDDTNMDPIIYRTTDDVLDTSPNVRSGEFELDCDFDYRENPTIAIVSDSVYPMAVLGLIPKMNYYGDQQ